MNYDTVSFENFYEGGASSLSPDYGNFTGYRMSAASLGFPGSPQTANQLGEAINAMKQGVKAFEVTMLQADMAETVPKQHFKEMRALMKLSGVKPSVHGPMIDAAGFDEKGNWGQEAGRQDNERRMFDTLEKARELGPEGNIPVVFHSTAGVPGAIFKPGKKEWGEDDKIMESGAMINKETGQAQAIKREYKFRPEYPDLLEKGGGYKRDSRGKIIFDSDGRPVMEYFEGRPKGKLFDAESTVDSANLGAWDDKLVGIAQMNKHAEEIIGELAPLDLGMYENAKIFDEKNHIVAEVDGGGRLIKQLPWFDEGQEESFKKLQKADIFLENAELAFNTAFHSAYKYGSDKEKKFLREMSMDYSKKKGALRGQVWEPIKRKELLNEMSMKLSSFRPPEVFQESNEFAMDKAAETFGNLAMKSYNDLGADKSPMIAIEPFHPGAGLADTEDMVKLVKKSREHLVKELMEKKGFGEGEAKRIAETKIGVTWDVGHINMIKKYGFTDKDIVKQTKKIAPMVKHVHLTDNFGYADTHLAPGMGNVPIKKIMEELEKTGRLGDMRKIVEAGAFVQHFKKSPHGLTMAAFGSPLYSMAGEAMGWNRAMDVQGAYFGGYGTVNPQTHHQYFGAGFTTMPVELGGQQPGGTSRFGSTPMA